MYVLRCRGCGKRFRRLAGHHAKNPACASRHVQEAQLAKRQRLQAGYSSGSGGYSSDGYSSDGGSGGSGGSGGGDARPSPSPGPLSGGHLSPPGHSAEVEWQAAHRADAPSSLAVQLPPAAAVSGACGLGLSYASDSEGGDSDNESSDGEAEQLAPLLRRLSLENQTLLELRRFLPDGDFNCIAPRLGSLDWNPTRATLTNAGLVKDFLRDVTGLELKRVKILQVGLRMYDMSRLADVKGAIARFLQSPNAEGLKLCSEERTVVGVGNPDAQPVPVVGRLELSTWMRKKQVEVFGGPPPPGKRILPVLVYLDKSVQEIGGHVYYPMILAFPTLPRNKVFRRDCYIRLALIPLLRKDTDVGLNTKTTRGKRLSLYLTQLAQQEAFGHVRNWATLKFWNMHAYEKCPADVAAAVYTDTASQEATHADLKRQGRFTNNRPDAVDAQVGARAMQAAATQQVLQEYGMQPEAGAEGVARRALEDNKPVLPSRGVRVALAELEAGVAAARGTAAALLAARPALQHLPFSLKAKRVAANKVKIFNSAGLPYRRHIGGPARGVTVRADPYFNGRAVHDDVAVRANNGEIWFGRAVAFVSTPYCAAAEATEWVFVRWFEQAPHTLGVTDATGMARLRWSTHMRRVGGGPLQRQPWYDLVNLRSVIEPVFLQPDPTAEHHFFFNHFVR